MKTVQFLHSFASVGVDTHDDAHTSGLHSNRGLDYYFFFSGPESNVSA